MCFFVLVLMVTTLCSLGRPCYLSQIMESMESNQEVINERLTAARAAAAATQEAAETYKTYVQLAQERFEKLPALEIVNKWLDERDAVFSAAAYGDSLVEVSTKLSSFDSFTAGLTRQQTVRANPNQIKSNQAKPQRQAY